MIAHLQKHSELVATPRDVHKAFLRSHLRFGPDTLLQAHQTVVVLTRFQHALLIVRFRILIPLASSETAQPWSVPIQSLKSS